MRIERWKLKPITNLFLLRHVQVHILAVVPFTQQVALSFIAVCALLVFSCHLLTPFKFGIFLLFLRRSALGTDEISNKGAHLPTNPTNGDPSGIAHGEIVAPTVQPGEATPD